MMQQTQTRSGSPSTSAGPAIQLRAPLQKGFEEILTPAALAFVAQLQRHFGATREKLLARRTEVQAKIDQGWNPDFLRETAEIRASDWRVASIPLDLQDRRVEITGPVDRKMVINALNSGASMFMADFEDSHSPTWNGTIEGQINLRDAIRRTISYSSPEGKSYRLNERTATLLVRPRGWHLLERHAWLDGNPVSASLFDFGLFFFHNARELLTRGSGPYFYLPKMENQLEARLWNDVFTFAQKELGIPHGSIRATVLIETILAAFEMDEILYELRDHSAGLNCGRWDYIFSFIKKFRCRENFVLPDRSLVTMNAHFLKSYCQLLIQTCHRRGIHAMGGMAAQIPIKGDPRANDEAMAKVRADKEREVNLGHDGTWVAHPGLVGLAREIFDAKMKTPNQIAAPRPEVRITAQDLLTVPTGAITEEGLRKNINVALLYMEAWLRGIGCVPLYNLMEDAATAEISRAQVWQWIRHEAGRLSDGRKVTLPLVREILAQEMKKIEAEVGSVKFHAGQYARAAALLDEITGRDTFSEFLTLPAYEVLEREGK
ncbi:MAG: malate synthase A [Bdellovibrionota bacterium]